MNKLYKVQYIGLTGNIESESIPAFSPEDAIDILGIDKDQVTNVGVDYLKQLLAYIPKPQIPIKDQAVILEHFSSSRMAGSVPRDSFYDLIPPEKIAKLDANKLAKCNSLSDFLVLLNFDSTTITLVKAGEEKNAEIDALQEASSLLMTEAEIKQKISGAVKKGKLQGMIGLLVILFGVPMAGGLVASMIENRIPMNKNVFSDLMLFMHSNFNIILIFYAALLFGVYSLYKLYVKKPYLPIFSLFYSVDKLKRGMMFCNMYRLLIPKGVTPPEIIDMLAESEKGFLEEMYQKLKSDLSEGASLVQAMPIEHWPSPMISLLPNLERIAHQKEKLIEVLLKFNKSLSIDLENKYEKIGSNLTIYGMSSLCIAVLFLFMGYYLPMFGNMSAMGR